MKRAIERMGNMVKNMLQGFFKNWRLGVLTLFPVLLYLWMSYVNISKIVEELPTVEIMLKNNQRLQKIVPLIHKLQKEREQAILYTLYKIDRNSLDTIFKEKLADDFPFFTEIENVRKQVIERMLPAEKVAIEYSKIITAMQKEYEVALAAKTTRGIGKRWGDIWTLQSAKEYLEKYQVLFIIFMSRREGQERDIVELIGYSSVVEYLLRDPNTLVFSKETRQVISHLLFSPAFTNFFQSKRIFIEAYRGKYRDIRGEIDQTALEKDLSYIGDTLHSSVVSELEKLSLTI